MVLQAVPFVTFVVLLLVERVRPLRRTTASRWRRACVNVGVAVFGGLLFAASYQAFLLPCARWGEVHGYGLLRWIRLPLPHFVRAVASFALLDYTLWVWHRLNHRVGFLWRFHGAHHADVDLDVSTAVRFHFGELLLSVPYRMMQVLIIGVDFPILVAWEGTLAVMTQMHHSNVRLPLALERIVRCFFITPRLHGIHHSVEERHRSSNFGTMLSVWDFVHATHAWDVPQADIKIGIPEVTASQGFTEVLAWPFTSRAKKRS